MSETSVDWNRLSPAQQEIWLEKPEPDAIWALVGQCMIIAPFYGVPSVFERDGSYAWVIWHLDEKI